MAPGSEHAFHLLRKRFVTTGARSIPLSILELEFFEADLVGMNALTLEATQ
jgi:hypothetical protein